MRVRRGFATLLCGLVLVSTSAAWAAQKPADPVAVTLRAAALDQYVGLYHGSEEPDAVDSVYREGDKLYIENERKPRAELRAEGVDRFFAVGTLLHMQFVRDAGGKVTGVTMMYGANASWSLQRSSDVGVRLNHALAYSRTVVMMPMRDGVKLHAVILRPVGSETSGPPLPFLMERTPYGTDDNSSDTVNSSKPELAASGYIFVYCDIRGRYESEGQFVMNRPIVAHGTKNDVDETTDTRDTIDWLLKNVPNNNGRVGVMGVSYPGFLAMMAGIDAHPAVKAISPQAPMTDVWMGDDFFHNGAFRETYGFDYVQELEKQKTAKTVESKEDTYDFFLKHVNFAGAAKEAHMSKLPTAKAFLTQPAYTKFWRDMAVQTHLTKVEVPALEVGGWWDQEDMWGTQAEYAALERHDTKHEVFLVLGPWNHGGWEWTTRHLGALDFGASTGDQYRKTVEAPFFEKYLKDRGGFDLKDTDSFRTGVNKWERYDVWPPKVGFTAEKLYLTEGGGLSFSAPVDGGVAASYVSDPANPIPYRHRPIQATYGNGSKWRTWLVEDQRFVSGRKDLANFSTPVLDHDVTVTGDVAADLFAATTGSDADWVVKLIDVYPDDAAGEMAGYQLMIADEIFRGRYVSSFEKPQALVPGKVTEFKWSLHGVDHTFLKGHRIMVEVQSSWFPLYDRNPQTYVPNIMTAPKKAYKAETETIYGSEKYPSHLEISVAQ
ncbi:CocE/NonD family hydrolase [Edaphobacter dinghuensis]|uniref:Glutaryl-7-ACA acylase n=1 Tax=Edaphobacter dinghuensis TaxID=1560005 RepID=A0A917HIX6_9BACT|nr:CocE/NonD family hydrolase [Edaphobacter dinghuensis]GGG80414.1 glutaryl-7-ACA acylase [Edaphobacter dinghuensis]